MKFILPLVFLLNIYSTIAQVIDFEGNSYNTAIIGNQVWLDKNLQTSKFNNGHLIFHAKTKEEWENAIKKKYPAWCYYDFDPVYGAKYGKIYNWYAVTDSRGITPNGFHIPHPTEWDELQDFIGYGNASSLKSKTGWGRNYQPNCNGVYDFNGDDLYGFSMLPGGYVSGIVNKKSTQSIFYELGFSTGFWTSKAIDELQAYSLGLDFSSGHIAEYNLCKEILTNPPSPKGAGYYIRCVKNN
jgi:uncharacterized protein (TIGR02145 family)